METEDNPSLGSSCCSAPLFLSLANLYEVVLPKCEGNSKGLQILLVFFVSFSFSSLSHSLLHLSLSSLTSSTSLHSQSVHAMYETFINLEQPVNRILSLSLHRILSFSQFVHVMYEMMIDLDGLSIVFYHSHSLYTQVMYKTMTDYG